VGFDGLSQRSVAHRTQQMNSASALHETLAVEEVSTRSDPAVGGLHRHPADRTDVLESQVGVGRRPHRVDQSRRVAATMPFVPQLDQLDIAD